MQRKICVFVGSRANWGRLKSVCKAITEHDALELQLILGASFYNADVEYPVSSRIQCLINSDDHESMALTTGILLTKVSMELKRLNPDIVLVHGDRYEVLAVAQASAYMNIQLAHTEGGEVTGCIDDKVRNAITALADIHFPVTYDSYMNTPAYSKKTYIAGSTAFDSIKNIRNKLAEKDDYIVLLHHPDTTTHEDIEPLINAVTKFNKKVIWVNPNIDAGYMDIVKKLHSLNWEFKKNLSPLEYAELIYDSACCVGNSSSFIKECSFLGVPSVVVGSRQKGRELDDNTIFVPMNEEVISIALEQQYKKQFTPSNHFGDGTASIKIANILAEVEL